VARSNCTGADLSHSDLRGSADLTNADFRFTNLYNALMQDANLTGAKEREAQDNHRLSSRGAW